jgi:hypothetical protein
MSVALTGLASVWVRLGKIFFAFSSAQTYSGDVAVTGDTPDLTAIGISYTDLIAQYVSNETELMATLSGKRDDTRGALNDWKSYLILLAQATVILQVDRDVTLAEDQKTLEGALKELITQMVGVGSLPLETAANDLDASTVSATPAAATTMVGASTGNGTLMASVKRPDGRQNQLVFAEVIELFCTSDAQTSGAGRAETWAGNGEPDIDLLDYRWPDGSGANFSLTTVDPSQNSAGGNLLTNSDFEDWTVTNVPDNWTVTVGTPGTDILKETSIIYGTHGLASLRIKGDAATLTSITQAFPTGAIKPNTVYHCNCYVKDSGAGLTAGVITFAFTDGSGTILADDAGNALSSTLAFSTTTASYLPKSFTFITPKALPTTGIIKFRIAVTTLLTSGESIYIDDLAVAEATEAYVGGPWLALFAGSTNPIIGDKFTVTVANDRAGTMLEYCDRFFGLKALRLQFPTDAAAGETILDSLIS